MEPERRFLECRAEGRTIIGAALSYGDIAVLPWGRERMVPGAFGDLHDADVVLNVQHRRDRPLARTQGGGLTLTDSTERLSITAELPATRDADDALELLRRRVLRGLSVEFHPVRERMDGQTRVLERATLSGIGLVDRPAYPASIAAVRAVEIRQRGLTGRWSYNTDTITSNRGRRRKERVNPGAFDLGNSELYGDREIDLFLGDRSQPLASKNAGSLEIIDGADAITIAVARLPSTTYAQDFERLVEEEQIVPGVRAYYTIAEAEDIPDQGPDAEDGVTIGVVTKAILTGFSIQSRQPRGNPGEVSLRRRKKIWL